MKGPTSEGAAGGSDPLIGASARFRRQWRRIEQQAVADESRRVLSIVRLWPRAAAGVDLDVRTNPDGMSTAVVRHGGWVAELGRVTGRGRDALLDLMGRGERMGLRDAGRYGPFWWMSFVAGPEATVVLGASLRLRREGGGLALPGGPPGLMPALF